MCVRRTPWIASLLSLLLPGLGHLYSGYAAAAGLRYLAYLGMTFLLFYPLLLWFPLGPVSLPVALALFIATYAWVIVGSTRAATRPPAEHPLRTFDRWYVYAGMIVASWGAGEIAVSPLRARIEAFRIPSGSMEPTLLVGDFLWAEKDTSARNVITHGSIVISTSPVEPAVVTVKRVVGVAGDTLLMIRNTLYRNAKQVDELYIRIEAGNNDPSAPEMLAAQRSHYIGPHPENYQPSARNWGPLLVPPDSLFLLGDNRDNAFDSRYTGMVATSLVRGQPRRIYFSYDKYGSLPFPPLTAIRWERIGTLVQ